MTELIPGRDTAVRVRSVCTTAGPPPSRTGRTNHNGTRGTDTAGRPEPATGSNGYHGACPSPGHRPMFPGHASSVPKQGNGSRPARPAAAPAGLEACGSVLTSQPVRLAEPERVPWPAELAERARRRRSPIDPDAVEAGIVALWRSFADDPSPANRDRLVLHYAPLVKYVAGRVGTGLPPHVEFCDLVQSGIFGLVDAIGRFEPDRGLKFETYAMQRIRGAILDDLRAQDWVPRSVRSRAREVERAMERLEAALHRTATEAELADELGITVDELRDFFAQLQLTSVAALDELVAAGRGTGSLAETLADHRVEDPVVAMEDRENRRLLAEAIAQLGERDRIVVSLYYFENLTLAEIGKVLGVTESRVCQLHTRAVLRLRTKLAGLAPS